MSLVKFANVLLETTPRALNYPGLYCKSDAPLLEGDNDQWILTSTGHYDFSTYYNALSVGKLREYTYARDFFLHLELKGAGAVVRQTHGTAFSHGPEYVDGVEASIPPSQDWQSVDLHLTWNSKDVLLGFVIDTEGPVSLRNGYYSVEIDHRLRPVNLALASTTFKKESYITGNIELVKEKIFGDEHDDCNGIKDHFHMYVIDNGRTLDAKALSDKHVTVVPNRNVGGAGGFTRGMILAMGQEPAATHVLLMDDDVSVSPESIKRTYNLLRIVNAQYKDAFISGAMLNYNIGDIQTEDVGFMNKKGEFQPQKPPLRVTLFEDIIFNEMFQPMKDTKHHSYAAWWYCVIPVSQIRRHGLPLPFFVRCDDAEFGVRCDPKFITMNGIGLWHSPFDVRYNAAVERYQTVRNTLIARFVTGFAPQSDFMGRMHELVRLEAKKFGYDNAELVLDAFEDFLKGPDFFEKKDTAESTFLAANRNKEKMVSFDELQKQAGRVPELASFNVNSLTRQMIDEDKPRMMYQRAHDFITDNSQRVFRTQGEGYAIVPANGWVYQPGVIRGKRVLVLIDWYNRKGCIRVKDNDRYARIEKRYMRDMRKFKVNEKKLHAEYSAARARLTSLGYWKQYLDMD